MHKTTLGRILLSTSIAKWSIEGKLRELKDNPGSENYQNMMDLRTELCILTNVYNLILPHIKLMIEKKIDGALEGELSASEDVFNYSNYYRYLTDKEMKNIADYLGLKYYFLHDDGFGYCACWTDNIKEVCEDKHIKD